MQVGNELIVESSRSPAKLAATAADPKVDLTDVAPSRAAEISVGPLVSQGSATLRHPTSKESEAQLFKNSNEALDYL